MDFKGALLKGLREIPSSSPLKSNPRQLSPVINPQPMLSSSILQDPPAEDNNPNWLDLPPELMAVIMHHVGWYDVLMNAKNVCKSWHRICKDLSVWQVLEIRNNFVPHNKVDFIFGEHTIDIFKHTKFMDHKKVDGMITKLAKHVVDLSSGQLLDLCFCRFGSNHLLQYICHRSSQLRRLRLEYCDVYSDTYAGKQVNYDSYADQQVIFENGLIQVLRNLPLLEELQFPYTWIPIKCIKVAGRCCPNLKSFTLNERVYRFTRNRKGDAQAIAIAKNMHKLRHLQLFGNKLTITGLMAILNNCHYLEYLDLRQCYNLCKVLEESDLETKLRQQIKHVRFPEDSTEDYEFDDEIYDSDGTL